MKLFGLSKKEQRPRARTVSSAGDTSLTMLCGACNIPDPEKKNPRGEDAFFFSEEYAAAGVSDGVGSWAEYGIDSGEFSRELMGQSFEAISKHSLRTPIKVLEYAVDNAKSPGTATAALLIFDKMQKRLHSACLGDSGYMVIRGPHVVYRSPEQVHRFNTPYQLSAKGSSSICREESLHAGVKLNAEGDILETPSLNYPAQAVQTAVNVEAGDIIVLATDGLWDNLYENEIIENAKDEIFRKRDSRWSFSKSSKAKMPPAERAATRLAQLAHQHAKDDAKFSPFSAKLKGSTGEMVPGGKMDDITVVVCLIVDADEVESADSGDSSSRRRSTNIPRSATNSFDMTRSRGPSSTSIDIERLTINQ